MPIYEYLCNDCGHEFETLQKMSDAPLCECPACNKNELKKMISAPGFRLSGSGWYETDFKSGSKKNLSQGDSGDSGDKGASAKADDKPAAKSKDSSSTAAAGKEAAA